MITTAEPRRSRVFEIALVLSIIVHLLGLLFYLGWLRQYLVAVQRQTQRQEDVATSDVVRLEKRTIPRVEVKQPPAPPVPPRRVVVQKPAPKAPPVQHREIARLTPHAPPRPAVAKPVIADTDPNARPNVVPRNQITQDDQAALAQRFSRAIAQSKSDLANIPPPGQPPSAIKRRELEIPGMSFSDLKRSEGLVDYVYASGREGDLNWHIIRVWITYPDGKTELVSIPWRFYFPRNNDPIESQSRRSFPAQPPPPGFVLPHPFQYSRFVCSYYPNECQALLDSEHNSGGGPATN